MSKEDIGVGKHLLNEVWDKFKQMFHDYVAFKAPDTLIEATGHTHWEVRDLLKELDLPEQKLRDDPEGLATIAFLRGRLSGLKFDYSGAVKQYEKAIQLNPSPEFEALVRYYLGVTHQIWDKREEAIENLEKVKALVGTSEQIGIDSAARIEKIKAKKTGCFIATAVYGSPLANDVSTLCEFRDGVLASSLPGRGFIRLYYLLSPQFAAFLGRHEAFRRTVRTCTIAPLVRMAKVVLAKRQGRDCSTERR